MRILLADKSEKPEFSSDKLLVDMEESFAKRNEANINT